MLRNDVQAFVHGGLCSFSQGPMELHGMAESVDVMIEAKCKERALMRFREAMKAGPSADAQMAMKFL